MFEVLLAVDSEEERALTGAEIITSLPSAAQAVQVTILNVQKEVKVPTASSDEWYDETDFPSSAEQAKRYLEDAGITVKMRREHGDPAKVISNISDETNVDCIVMAGRKRTPTGKVLFGSVTQSVLLESDSPVMVTTS